VPAAFLALAADFGGKFGCFAARRVTIGLRCLQRPPPQQPTE
jgi:hypothetical protein